MRTANICPTCSTFSNALCTIYNGLYLPALDIEPLDNLEIVINKIENFAAASSGATPSLQVVTDIGAITTNTMTAPSIQYTLDADVVVGIGELAWNTNEETLDLGLSATSTLQVGQELHHNVTNSSGIDIPNGTPVMSIGTQGNTGRVLIAAFDGTDSNNIRQYLGVATEFIANGANGKVSYFGKVRGIQTDGGQYGEVWVNNDVIWADSTSTTGALTNVVPSTGAKVQVARVINSNPANGSLDVLPHQGNTIRDLSDVDITGLADGVQLQYNDVNDTWEVILPPTDVLLYPVENSYPAAVDMFADQINQTENFFQYQIDTDTYYEYLGTTAGDITDYRELSVDETTIIKGKFLPPVAKIYTDAATMYGDQNKQQLGFIYRTQTDDVHYEFLGTRNGDATDYKQIGAVPSLQAVTDVGNTTTLNIAALSFNDLALFAQTGVDVDNIGIGVNALSSNTGVDCIGIGTSALQTNSGTQSNGVGVNALQNNSGGASNGLGLGSLQNNSGGSSNGIGNYVLSNNIGSNTNAFGLYSAANNRGTTVNAFGHYSAINNTGNNIQAFGNNALQNNIAASSNAFGTDSLVNNTGIYSNAFGSNALYYNSGTNSSAFGHDALRYNQVNNNTALGYKAYSTFIDNVAGDKTFDFTDINVSTDRVTITAHGFGVTNAWVNVLYTQGTSNITGLTNGQVYQVKIIDANTISFRELIAGTTYHGTDITNIGTGTGHTLTPQLAYNNVTVLGANAEPTKSNQVTLGDTAVTEVVTAGTYVSGGYVVGGLPTGVTGARAYVTDSTVVASGNFGATVIGGGANTVPVFYDGTNWIIA